MPPGPRSSGDSAVAKLVYSDAFIEDMTAVKLASKRAEIFDKADLLSDFPDLGSANVPESIRANFGSSVRKLVVSPFDVIYEHDPEASSVNILGLVHQRAAH